MERFGRGFGVENRDRRPKGGRIFFVFLLVGWIVKHSFWMGKQMYILQGFLLVDSFLCLTKHHFWRLVLYEALYLSKDNQLLKQNQSTFHGDSETWTPKTLACGYLAVPKVIGSYGSCRAKVAA